MKLTNLKTLQCLLGDVSEIFLKNETIKDIDIRNNFPPEIIKENLKIQNLNY